jgi:hypothetical protein
MSGRIGKNTARKGTGGRKENLKWAKNDLLISMREFHDRPNRRGNEAGHREGNAHKPFDESSFKARG